MQKQTSSRTFIITGVVIVLIVIAFFVGHSIRKAPVLAPISDTFPTPTVVDSVEVVSESEVESSSDTIASENITTPLYVKSVYQKNGRWWADVDYFTRMRGVNFLEYQINTGKCTIANMAKSALLAEARRQTTQTIEESIFFDNPSCPGDWYITFEFGQDVNQSQKIRSFPFSSDFRVINACSLEEPTTPSELAYNMPRYDTGYRVIKANIVEGQISSFDFSNACLP